MAHLKKSATTGHLLKTSTGHLSKGCPSCADCTCTEALLNYSLTYTPCGSPCYCSSMQTSQSGTMDLIGDGNPCVYDNGDQAINTWELTLSCAPTGFWQFYASDHRSTYCGNADTGYVLSCTGGKPVGSISLEIHDYGSPCGGGICGTVEIVFS